jgi:hypothetical protein
MKAGENSRTISTAPHSHRMYQPVLATTVTVLTLIAISPAFLVDIPAMVDYPNHLARMYVLAAAGTPDANPFYEVTWSIYSNIAMDILVPLFARLVGVEPAMKSFLIASQVLIVSGAVALEYAVKRRHEMAGLAAVLMLYSLPFSWGFLNFQFALGVGLFGLAIAVWLAHRSVLLRFAMHIAIVAALYVAHLFALGLYLAALGLIEFACLQRDNWQRVMLNLVLISVPVLVVLALSHAAGRSVGNGATEWELASKLRSVFRLLNGYSVEAAAASAAIVIGALYVLFRWGALQITRTGTFVVLGFALLFVATPYRLHGSAYVDIRVVVALALILPAFVAVSAGRVKLLRRAGVAIVAVALVNIAITGAVWLSYRADYAQLKISFAPIGKVRVLIGRSVNEAEDILELPMHHAPTLAVSVGAMVPTLYALPGMQPIRVTEEGRNTSITDINYYSPVPLEMLLPLAHGSDDARIPRFIRHWAQEFDYLYLVGPILPNPLPEQLHEVGGGPRFTMYRIR